MEKSAGPLHCFLRGPGKTDKAAFLRLHALLEKLYLVVHERLQREIVDDLSVAVLTPPPLAFPVTNSHG